jgi:hypothetical protein
VQQFCSCFLALLLLRTLRKSTSRKRSRSKSSNKLSRHSNQNKLNTSSRLSRQSKGNRPTDHSPREVMGAFRTTASVQSFGRSHTFHVNRSDFEGSRRFQYGGFWFNVLDPWPVGWLYTDNVYVDYINSGYFLCDPVHPGVYISINIG